jgi:cell division protease FtsH
MAPAGRDQSGAAEKRRTPSWRVEGMPPETESTSRLRMRSPGGRRFWWFIALALALNVFLATRGATAPAPRAHIAYTVFRQQLKAANVRDISARDELIQGDFKRPIRLAVNTKPTSRFETRRPAFANDGLLRLLIARGVSVDARNPDAGRSVLATILFSFGPTLLFVGLFLLLARRLGGGASALTGLGRSRAKRYDASGQRTTFADVAGIDDAEAELVEIVDFLKQPDRYVRLGGRIPRGVLLSGPPGTGKTLLARAVAGEAGVPFFSLSASEFIEMIVGVGASRVRDLFDKAKAVAPAIVFIDELDAIGRSRGAGNALGGHDEREQTLNQILTELDGFDGTEGVIVIAATNRPEILDPALLRPGRFDRRVSVNPPDRGGRKLILEVHTRHVPLDHGVDLGALASATSGMVGADLKNLVNEAALTAARRDHDRVELSDFTDALEKILLGAARKIMLSPAERERTAYHESGHALLGMLQPGSDPVRKISIIPRGRALGATFQSPESDRYGFEAAYLRGRIIGALGGRAAEEIVYGEITTGAESDLEQVTGIARQMVGRWGMSEAIGPVSVLPGPLDEPLLFPGVGGGSSEHTRELVDSEVRRIVDECYEDALTQLRVHRVSLDALAHALLERETLDEVDAYRFAGLAPPEQLGLRPAARTAART